MLHLVLPLLADVLVPILGLPAGVNTILLGLSVVGGPNVLLISAIGLLGKGGVAELMGKAGKLVKRVTRWDSVTKERYTVGLRVLVISLVSASDPFLSGTNRSTTLTGGPGWGFYLLLLPTFAFIGAVLSMGAPLWARIQASFTWEAEIVLPEPDAGAG